MPNISNSIVAKCQQFEKKELELNQLSMSYDMLMNEKQRLENESNGLNVQSLLVNVMIIMFYYKCFVAAKDLMKDKEQMDYKISSLNLKIENINSELIQAKTDRDFKESEKLQFLMAENKKLVQDFKGLFNKSI